MFCVLIMLTNNLLKGVQKLVHYIYNMRNVSIRKLKKNNIKDLEVLFESSNFLVVNKTFDLLINCNDRERISLEHQLAQRFPQHTNSSLFHRFYFVHRLDFSTSGAICIPITKEACQAASSSFMDHKTTKVYLALVRGYVRWPYFAVDIPIGKDSRTEFQSQRTCTPDKPYCCDARDAKTHFLILERGLYNGYPATKLLIRPITGRRHQIRVHCAEIGHIIVGDFTYSDKKDVDPYRMFLHGYRLVIPNSVENLDVVTSDPFSENDPINTWIPVEKLQELGDKAFLKLAVAPEIVIGLDSDILRKKDEEL